MNWCPACGQQGMRGVTHICGGLAITPTRFEPVNDPQPGGPPPDSLDEHHWLYKAGYEQGYQDALKTRDLSPLGGGPTQ